MKRFIVGAFAVVALAGAGALAGDAPKSGLPVGGRISAFNPLSVTGPFAGKKQCLVWAAGPTPTVAIFARDVNEGLTSLVKKVDAASAKFKRGKEVVSFVVFLSDDEKMDEQLKDFAKKAGISNTVLSIDNVAGPKEYKIAKDAEITVLVVNKQTVEANHSFRKGELNEKAIERVLEDVSKLKK